jgi:menaquinone-dependent protoporphyrinogen oxidase
MTVLVAYGTRAGSTAELAEWIAQELRDAGVAAQARPAAEVDDVGEYSALVLGGAVYAGGWHPDARAFAKRFADRFAGRPVWMFSTGPLDDTAETTDLPPDPQARAAMTALGAREHVTFGGRLSEETRGWLGFVARRMAREAHGGDFRNPERVRAWARTIAGQLT